MTAMYAPNVIMFSIAPPLKYKGQNKEATEKWFNSYESNIASELKDLNIRVSNDVAFCFYFYHISGTLKQDNKQVDMWVRITQCFEKINEQWLVTHEHQSVPFNMETFEANLDLKP